MSKALDNFVKAVASQKFESINISSDGTNGGTKITLNGKAIDGLDSLYFQFYNTSYYNGVTLEFVVSDREAAPGTLRECRRFCLIPPGEDKADASLRESDLNHLRHGEAPPMSEEKAVKHFEGL